MDTRIDKEKNKELTREETIEHIEHMLPKLFKQISELLTKISEKDKSELFTKISDKDKIDLYHHLIVLKTNGESSQGGTERSE